MTIETVAGLTDLQIKLFTAVGQILVATAVGFIALRQWLTARNKLKADLFDWRYDLVKELRRGLCRVGQDARQSRRQLRPATVGRSEHQQVVAAGRCHFNGVALMKLAAYVTQIGHASTTFCPARRSRAKWARTSK